MPNEQVLLCTLMDSNPALGRTTLQQTISTKTIDPIRLNFQTYIQNILCSPVSFLYELLEIKTYTLACLIFQISQFSIYKPSNIMNTSLIFNILHIYKRNHFQGERTQDERVLGRTCNRVNVNQGDWTQNLSEPGGVVYILFYYFVISGSFCGLYVSEKDP